MDYREYVKNIEQGYRQLSGLGQGSLPKLGAPSKAQPVALIIAPHPDDECLMGSYALRMQEEWGARVYVYPFSFGSNPARQAERQREMESACAALGFELLLDQTLVQSLKKLHPDYLFSPHSEDGHPVHQKAHIATLDAMNAYLDEFPDKTFHWLQTEFWHAMKSPNLLIPIKGDQVVKLGEALMKHVGEVSRNPYHLRLPAWFMDQVRRGSEQVAGMGSAGHADWVFGQLYCRIDYGRS